MNDSTDADPPRPMGRLPVLGALLLVLFLLVYPTCYFAQRASHRIVHVHWGALGRGGCSSLRSSRSPFVDGAWAPAVSVEAGLRGAFDPNWGGCPEVTE